MSNSVASARYAQALLAAAEARGEMPAIAQGLEEVCRAVKQYPEISHLLLNSTIARAEKEDFLEKIFPPPTPTLLIQFLKVLVKKRRFSQLNEIKEHYLKLFGRKQGIVDVTVISAVPLSLDNEKKLMALLEKKLNSEIRLHPKTESHILGGLILQFDGYEINGSFRSRLDELKRKLSA